MFWPSDPNSSWRLWFLRPRPGNRTHHLYLIQHADPHLSELTAFRDRLRSDPLARDSYSDLKQLLAQQYREDRDGYTAAKGNFVAELLQQSGIEMKPRPEADRRDQIKVLTAPSDAADDLAAGPIQKVTRI
ncbi:GrpB family protein [Mycobacterium sp. CBMA293]|uniref:GrpB family protein n=1 Tax=unclassified Mycolicibacterium TaxID=2636767 RepID=UPI0012DC1E6B|nr:MULTISPECIES: GrpB family protein [unclassified Mycolicibacterium]MUL48424.1 GrpB family protein [Mycolicibacterium sp. CBMA 360]MUL62282.1 GrpB family protein [Mycolicibacterium sp. CBMA 335]MUM04573.1 hypothetical protein [Mycolicibacterium sp. CBMA 213]MUM14682.1 GrpB family protein [Mycolicibacterium sp. CBMA 293]MUM31067.1 GrpB family protein [Mycolicibacterium sp. CBMA 361]